VANHDKSCHRIVLVALLVTATLGLAQQPRPAAPEAAQTANQPGGQQALDLEELIARDVLEPLRDGIQTQNLKEVLSVFDPEAVPQFPQLRDQIRAFLDSHAVLQFRYQILQASSGQGNAAVICQADLDATPRDPGQVPMRRSTQLRLKLKQTPKGWRISAFNPSDFFAQ
jgi:hypothetical protein